MTEVLLWKEYRQQRSMWLAIVILAVILIVGLGEGLAPGGFWHVAHDEQLRPALVILMICLMLAYGVVCGALLLAGEKDDGTLIFLDIQTGQRGPLWQTKLAAGMLFTISQAAALSLLSLGLGLGSWQTALILLGLGLDALLYGLLGGALCATVLTAVLAGVVVLAGTWAVALLLGPLALLLKVIFGLGSVYLAWRYFCEPDLNRQAAAHLETNDKKIRSPSPFQAMLWLLLRQGQWILVGCLVVVLAGALTMHLAPLYLWPLLSWVLGLACGLAVFAPEQVGEKERFLGAQRFPPGRFWNLKLAFWGLTTFVSLAFMLLLALGLLILRDAHRGTYNGLINNWWERWVGDSGLYDSLDMVLFFTLWPLYGFTFGQFFSQLARRPVLAVILSAFCSALVLALWVPSLVSGGLRMWQVGMIPLLLLVCTRLTMWPWVASRLHSWRPMVGVGSALIFSLVWMAGNLWYRVAEIPDVGEPFDLQAFENKLRTLKEKDAGVLLRQAARDFQEHAKKVQTQLGSPTRPVFPELGPDPEKPMTKLQYADLLGEVLDHGWPTREGEIGRYLDLIFKGEWATQMAACTRMPPGLENDPRYLAPGTSSSEMDAYRSMTGVFQARALQLQARGEQRQALEQVETLLGLSRQMGNCSPWFQGMVALAVEHHALITYYRWLDQAGNDPKLLGRAMTVLQKHQADYPDPLDNMRAEYIMIQGWEPGWLLLAENRLSNRPKNEALAQWLGRLLQLPWERARYQRLVKAVFLGNYQEMQKPYWEPLLWTPRRCGLWADWNEHHGLKNGLPPPKGPGTELTASQWGFIIRTSLWQAALPQIVNWTTQQNLAKKQLQLRVPIAVTALAWYQAEKGKPAERLEELLPRYLPEVPLDPFTGQPLQYRISQGEEITALFPGDWTKAQTRTLAPGQGLLWIDTPWFAPGPDQERKLYFPVPVDKP